MAAASQQTKEIYERVHTGDWWQRHRSDVAQQSRLPPGSASVPRYGSDSLQLGGLGVPVDIWDPFTRTVHYFSSSTNESQFVCDFVLVLVMDPYE